MCDNQLTVSSFFNCFGALLLLKATAPGLEDKLGKLAPAHAVAGHIAPYLVDRLVEVYLFVYTFFFSFFFLWFNWWDGDGFSVEESFPI